MKILFYLFVLSAIFSFSYSQNYKQIKIYPTDKQDIENLAIAGIDFEHAGMSKDNGVIIFVNEKEFETVSSSGIRYEVLIEDWFTHYDALPKLTESEKDQVLEASRLNYNVDGFDYGSMGGFYTYQEIIDDLDEMYSLYPNIITQKINIGTTHEGRVIYAAIISDNPNVTENEPGAGYDALIHAREPQSMATQMYFMWYLLQNYGTNPEVTYLVNNRQLYFIPCFNPDGYEYNRQTNPNGGGLWRKNRRNNGSSYGVDMNRNYSYQWGYDNTGSSPTPSSETYRGPSPLSEPETQAVTNFIISKNIQTHFNMHSGASAFIYPWGYINQACPDFAIYDEYCQDMVSYNGYEYGTGAQVLGYTSNGSARDWLYGEQTVKDKIFGYTYEIDEFWPSQSQIIPVAQLNLGTLLYHAWVAGEYVQLINPNFDHQFFTPGDMIELSIPSLKNKGLSDAQNISLSLSSDNPEILINSGSVTIGGIPARTSVNNNQNLSFTIGNIPPDVTVKLMVTVFTDGTPMYVDTLRVITGVPSMVFSDTTNTISNLWTITSSPTNPRWEATTSSFYSAPNSYTDSRTGSYANNATVTMTLTNSIDLSGYSNPRLVFWTKYDIESNWDYGQVEISTNNGSSWTPLAGNYTQAGTGSFQPNGQPVYDGTQNDWVYEQMDLSSYLSNQVKIKFELRTDGSQTRDGWYVDDIGIVVYTYVPVELSSFNAKTTSDGIKLSWKTSSETNNSGFEIQRKYVNQKDWQKLGFVEGSGTTTESKSYSYTDKNLNNGSYQYRLKQIDYDGSFKYSDEVNINYSMIIDFELAQNYPNPFNPETTIKYAIPNSGKVLLKVYNVLGKEVITLVNEVKEAGEYEVQFNAGELSSGVYFYKIEAGEFSKIRKMILLR